MFREGVAWSIMVGVGESYLAAYVLALGLGEVLSGLISTIPLLVGGALQLVTPLGLRWLGSRRRWTVLCAVTQAGSFIPLIAGALAGGMPAWSLFACASVYWGAGMATGPAWNAWVEWLVPAAVRTRFFARRSSAVHLGVVSGLVAGGFVLQNAARSDRLLAGFALLFGVALASRIASALFLAAQSEPRQVTLDRGLPALELLRRFPSAPAARLVIYLLTLAVAVQVASPFFSAFMLVRLELDYWQYTTLVGTAMVAKVIVLPVLPGLAKRVGLVVLLRVAWLGIAAIPVLWLLSSAFPYLMLLQIAAGCVWATHEYATFLLLFETIHVGRRVGILTAYNLGNAIATVGGSLAGAQLFALQGGYAGFVTIFVVSTILRAACVVLLVRVRGVRAPDRPIAFRPVSVNPVIGILIRPVWATIRRRPAEPPAPKAPPE
jgi:MFS family permease